MVGRAGIRPGGDLELGRLDVALLARAGRGAPVGGDRHRRASLSPAGGEQRVGRRVVTVDGAGGPIRGEVAPDSPGRRRGPVLVEPAGHTTGVAERVPMPGLAPRRRKTDRVVADDGLGLWAIATGLGGWEADRWAEEALDVLVGHVRARRDERRSVVLGEALGAANLLLVERAPRGIGRRRRGALPAPHGGRRRSRRRRRHLPLEQLLVRPRGSSRTRCSTPPCARSRSRRRRPRTSRTTT